MHAHWESRAKWISNHIPGTNSFSRFRISIHCATWIEKMVLKMFTLNQTAASRSPQLIRLPKLCTTIRTHQIVSIPSAVLFGDMRQIRFFRTEFWVAQQTLEYFVNSFLVQQSFGIGEVPFIAHRAHETAGRSMTLLMLFQTSFELEQLTANRAHELHFAIVIYEHIWFAARTMAVALMLRCGRHIVERYWTDFAL